MPRRSVPIVFCAILAAGGCSRTDDGTVIIPRPLDMRRVDLGPLDLRHPGYMRAPAATPLAMPPPPETFPVAPQSTSMDRPRARPAKRRVRHAASPSPVSVPLACEAATQTGKRVRVMCE